MTTGNPGPLSQLQAAVEALNDINDPIQRASAAADLMHLTQQVIPRIKEIRQAAVLLALERRSAEELAAELGVSKARVYALASGKSN